MNVECADLAGSIKDFNKYPMLSAKDEFELATRWRQISCPEAIHRLTTSHLRLVAKIASGYANYGTPLDDLMSEGYVGLVQAINRFEPERGFRLSTYASWWIRASILDFIIRSKSIVKIGTTVHQKRLFFNLSKAKNEIRSLHGNDLSPDAIDKISERLKVLPAEVVAMDQRLASADTSLNSPIGDGRTGELQDLLVDERKNQEIDYCDNQEFGYRRRLVARAMENLNERERDIFVQRRLNDDHVSLRELGTRYSVSPERIRQIEINAFRKVQKSVRQAAVAAFR